MTLRLYTTAQKRHVVDELSAAERRAAQSCGQPLAMAHRYQVLSAIASDLRARENFAGSATTAELERHLRQAQEGRDDAGYATGDMIALANIFISKWPLISQALKQFEKDVQS